MIRVALDAMGTDTAPASELAGAALALRELPPDFTLTLVGPVDRLTPLVAQYPDLDPSRVSLVEAPDVIGMDEKPLLAVRRRPNSSIVVGLQRHRAGEVDAFVSAGNTGAMLAASTMFLGLHTGVERATVAALLPAINGPVLLLDSGATLESTARELVNFARLGSLYMADVHHRPRPKVGLLNVGEEPEKGTDIHREAFAALQANPRLHFIGNIEGRDIAVPHPIHGTIDVVVCDGFVGNVVLKFYESMGGLLTLLLKQESPSLLTQPELRPLMRFLDYSHAGGAPLLGVRGVPIVCHGSSNPNAIRNAIRTAIETVRSGLNDHISTEMATTPTEAA